MLKPIFLPAFFFATAVFCYSLCPAQYVDETVFIPKEDSKVSLSLDLTPVAAMLMFTAQERPRLAAGVKFKWNDSRWKALARYTLRENFEERDINEGRIVRLTRDTVEYQLKERRFQEADVVFAKEWFDAKSDFGGIYSVGINVGYAKDFQAERTLLLDSAKLVNLQAQSVLPFVKNESQSTAHYLLTGIDLSVGMRWRFLHRYSLSLIWNPNVVFRQKLRQEVEPITSRNINDDAGLWMGLGGVYFTLDFFLEQF